MKLFVDGSCFVEVVDGGFENFLVGELNWNKFVGWKLFLVVISLLLFG